MKGGGGALPLGPTIDWIESRNKGGVGCKIPHWWVEKHMGRGSIRGTNRKEEKKKLKRKNLKRSIRGNQEELKREHRKRKEQRTAWKKKPGGKLYFSKSVKK